MFGLLQVKTTVITISSHVQVWRHDQHVHVRSMCVTSVTTHESRECACEEAVAGQLSNRLCDLLVIHKALC
jgi:hypothetical protein